MKVKICGITNLEDALLCCKLGADALGFVFYEKSKRFISYDKAKEIISNLPPLIVKVGVFAGRAPEEINSAAGYIGLNAVQYHSEIVPGEACKISFPLIKAFRVTNGFNFGMLSDYSNCTFLLDSFSENSLGGTGRTFNWEIIPTELRSKIILAGGISSNNIEYVYRNFKPYAVDLSSSVESAPGKKDKNKLTEFFNIVNQLRYSK